MAAKEFDADDYDADEEIQKIAAEDASVKPIPHTLTSPLTAPAATAAQGRGPVATQAPKSSNGLATTSALTQADRRQVKQTGVRTDA
jgi:hypothetical protein